LPSEVHVLLCENGAGKSTLVKIISGAYHKSSGSLKLEGQEIDIKNPRHDQELGISIIYQELNLIPKLSAAENIFLGREYTLVPGVIDQKEITDRAQKILDDLGVSINARSLVEKLGVAEKQMIEVAKELSLDAKILIFDEPTRGIDVGAKVEIYQLMNRLKAEGAVIIMISSELPEILGMSDRVMVMREGMVSGLAAIILTARLNSAQPIAGIIYELDAIAATVICGTSLMGGEGRVVGTLIGALIMGVLRNGLNLLGISSFIQQIVIGSVIIIAVLIDMALKKRRN